MQQSIPQFIIRISRDRIAFALKDAAGQASFVPYQCRSGVSVAVNLREAFRDENILRMAGTKAKVLVDAPTLIIPIEEYTPDEVEEQYHYTFPGHERESIELSVLPAMKNIAAFAVEKDLKTVLTDNFEEVKMLPLMANLWEFLQQRSVGGSNKKLYAYFHDGKMDLCSFNRNRFRFCNTFEVSDIHDAVYFLLGVWKQIAGRAMDDDLFLAGNSLQRKAITDELKKYLRRVYYINPTADFNRSPVTEIPNLPLDTMLYLI